MRRLIITTTIGAVALFVPVFAAAQLLSGDRTNIAPNQTINDDLYVAGNQVVIAGTINGDVYVAAKSVEITGKVNGDVLAAAQDVRITGQVKGSVRTAANTTTYDRATIGGSVSDISQSLAIDEHSTIGGGLNFAAATATVDSSIARGITAGGSSIRVNGRVGTGVTVTAQHLVLGDQARVTGAVTTYRDTQLERASGSEVSGAIQQYHGQPFRGFGRRTHVLEVVWGVIALYLVGAALLWLAPKPMLAAATYARTSYPRAFGWGLAAILLIVPLVFVLAITIIGIPLAVVAVAGFGLAVYLAKFIASLALGTLIARRAQWRPNPYADVLVGLITLTIIGIIPVVGGLVSLIAVVGGLGAIIASIRPRRPIAKSAA